MAKSVQAIVVNIPASDGGKPFYSGYRANLHFDDSPDGDLHGITLTTGIDRVLPGETAECTIQFTFPEYNREWTFVGSRFSLQDGPFIRATGEVTDIDPDQ